MALVLETMNVARMNPYGYDQGTLSAHRLVRTPTASSGHPTPGGDTRSSTYLVDDVHQARISQGVGDWDNV